MKKISVLFVCMGNICRSPTAEAVFRSKVEAAGLVQQIAIDSAGTHDYHIGNPPDRRAQHAAKMRGYEIATFSIVLADKIPGHFARLSAIFSNTQKDTATLEEFTTLDGVGEIK